MVEALDRDHVRLLVNAREARAAPKTIRKHHGLLFSVREYPSSVGCTTTTVPRPFGEP